jgi:hypothetical protein
MAIRNMVQKGGPDCDSLKMRVAELRAMKTPDVASIARLIRKKIKDRETLYAGLEEKARFFNLPTAMADVAHWGRAATWTLEEAVALSLGRDPDRVSASTVEAFTNISAFASDYLKRRDLVRRALHAGVLVNPTSPGQFLTWMERNDFTAPDKLRETVNRCAEMASSGYVSPAEPTEVQRPPAYPSATTMPPTMHEMSTIMAHSGYTEEQLLSLALDEQLAVVVFVPSVRACKVPPAALEHFISGVDEYEVNGMTEHYSGAKSGLWTIKRKMLRIEGQSWDAWSATVATLLEPGIIKAGPAETQGAPSLTTKQHRIGNRIRILDAEIAQAKENASTEIDASRIWQELTKLAEAKFGALIGFSSDGIQYRGRKYQKDGEPDVFTFKNLRDRMGRAKAR